MVERKRKKSLRLDVQIKGVNWTREEREAMVNDFNMLYEKLGMRMSLESGSVGKV